MSLTNCPTRLSQIAKLTHVMMCSHRCFDRILLNGLIQPFQQPERVVGFFSTYRH